MLRKKILGLVMAGAVILTGMCGTGNTVNAAGTEKQVSITKTIEMDKNVSKAPDADFTFSFTKNTTAASGLQTNGITIPDVTISFAGTETGTVSGDLRKVSKEGVLKYNGHDLKGTDFPDTGIYAYTVKETNTNLTKESEFDTIKNSKAEYILFLTVTNSEADNTKIISDLVIKQTKTDEGMTPGGNGKVDAAEFTNIYEKNAGPNPDPHDPDPDPEPDPDLALIIDKTVTGNLGDKTKDFNFELTMTKNATADAGVSYTGTIYDSEGSTTGRTVKATVGQKCTFTLSHGEVLKFPNVPVGTTYKLNETAVQNYSTTVTGMESGKAIGETTMTSFSAKPHLIGEGENRASVENEYNSNPITGIFTNNLPYILLIGAAVIGFALYLAAKRRMRRY